MRHKRGILTKLYDLADLNEEPIPGASLIELFGDRRVLIENHKGILSYTEEEIWVKLCEETVMIQGLHLHMCQMTKDQLVISGRIISVSFRRFS